MSDVDTYFTQSIVGAPFSAVLGARVSASAARERGVDVPLHGGAARVGAFCQDELLIGSSSIGPFVRRMPTPVRRWAERHALIVACAGLLALGISALNLLWTHGS